MTHPIAPASDGASTHFGVLPVDGPIARALRSMGYDTPTPIQVQAVPLLREGRDMLGQAQTGTGKTAGFGIPLIETINTDRNETQAIVLVPTRELCLQVADELARLGRYRGVRVLAVYGGVGFGRQLDGLSHGAHVVVGTPGRIEDHLQRGSLRLNGVRVAILDEADRMLDVGFRPAIERILARTPRSRQTALFSATLPEEVRDLALRQTRDPVTVAVTPEKPTVDAIEQRFERVENGDKLSALRAHLDDPACWLALVFRRTTYKADRLTRDLTRGGYKAAALHGRRTQGQRERVLGALKSGDLQVLVATDIAARGLDIAGLTHVFNFDLPDTPDTYIHRIGRTGRAGESGTAITFIAPEDDETHRTLERYLARRATPATVSSDHAGRPRRRERTQDRPRRDDSKPGRQHAARTDSSRAGVSGGRTGKPSGTSDPRRRGHSPRSSTAA